MLGLDWESIGHAGFFFLGGVLGGLLVARVTKIVMEYLRREDD